MGQVRLRAADGTPKYVRAIRYHVRTTDKFDATRDIGREIKPFAARLIDGRRATEDAMGEQVEATADANFEDARADDFVRVVFADVGTMDRADPTLGLKAKLFPKGLTAVIARTGVKQAEALEALAGRLRDHSPELAEKYGVKLSDSAGLIRLAVEAQETAMKKVAEAQANVRLLKLRVREQFEANAGALRILFRGNPKYANRFFIPTSSRTRADKEDEAEEGAPAVI